MWFGESASRQLVVQKGGLMDCCVKLITSAKEARWWRWRCAFLPLDPCDDMCAKNPDAGKLPVSYPNKTDSNSDRAGASRRSRP